MADNEDIKLDESNISAAEAVKDAMLEIKDATKEANKSLKEQGQMLIDYGGLYSGISRSASKVAEIQQKASKSSKATKQALAEQAKNQAKVQTLNSKINDLYSTAAKLSGEAKEAVIEQAKNLAAARDNAATLADTYGDIANDAAKLDARTSFFTGISDVVSDIPGLRKLAGPFQDAAKAARETVIANAKGGKKMSVLASGAKGFAKSAASSAMNFLKSGGYVGLLVGGVTGLVKLMLAVDQNTAKTAKAFNETKKEAAATAFNFQKAETSMNFLTSRLGKGLELARGFASATGIISKNTEVFNSDLDTLNQKFGLSTDQTNDLAKNLLASGQNTKTFAKEALGAAEALEMQNGVNIQSQAIMQDIASASAAFKVNSGNSAKALGSAAAQARKVGLSLSQVEGISSSLLNFESSIENEMNAQLMTGKAMNLDKARQAALTGDLATVAQEVAKQEAVQEAFATKNVLAQEAVAKALGMSREDLAKMYTEQKALEAAGFSSAEAREEEFKRLEKIHGTQKALKLLGDEEYTRMKNNISFQDKMNNLVDNLKSIFMTSLEPVVNKVTGYLESNPQFINDIVDKVKLFAESLGGPEGKLVALLDSFKSIKNVVKGLGQILTGLLVNPIKAAYFAGASLVESMKQAYFFTTLQFDKAFEAGRKADEFALKAAANVVDVGTNVIKGVATMAGNEELGNAKTASDYVDGALNVKDFTIRPLGEDTITMAGGTKLGGNVEKLLEQLISIVSNGGDVYLDGAKVGQTLVLNSKLSN